MKLYKYNCGLYIGRFQPLHFGHLEVIQRMHNECRIPVLVIGSAQESRTYGNPFTYQERKRMVTNYPGLERLHVMPINDIFNLSAWAKYALDTVERKIKARPSVYYCGTSQDMVLFAREGINIALKDRDEGPFKGLSASKVRSLILAGQGDWKQYVPTMNHKLIQKVYGGKAK